MNNTKWSGGKSRYVRILCTLLLVVGVGTIGALAAHPAMADGDAYDIPASATQAWVDVESAKASEAGVRGTFNDASVAFKPSPSGVTAVVDVSAIQGKQAALQLQSRRGIKALVAVTFADKNDVVVSEYVANAVIEKIPTTVEPGQPVKPVTNKTVSSSVNALGKSGISILGAMVAAILVAAAGLLFMMLRRKNTKRTASKEELR